MLHLTSDSEEVRIPALVAARPNQGTITFQVSIDPAAGRQTAAIGAVDGDTQVQDTIAVIPAAGPVLKAPGSQMVKPGERLSFAVSAIDPDNLPLQLSATGLPERASFDASTGQFSWVPSPSEAGRHDVTFSAVNSAGVSSTERVGIEVGTGVPILNQPQELACSPNAIAIVSGEWLAASPSGASEPSGSTVELGGTKLKVNGQYVPVLSASPTEVDFVCPSMPPGTRLAVAVETASGVSGSLSTVMQSASPRIFGLAASGQSQGVVSFVGTTELAMARNSQVAAHPAQPGDEILLWGTGFGSSSEALPGIVSVKVGGVGAEVEAVNAVPGRSGVYTVQVRVPVPTVFGDGVPVQVQVIGSDGKLFSSNSVTVAVELVMQ
jgi:uncharacterized protein (TIGR03437 family)